MLKLFVKCRRVDMDTFLGRELHPQRRHEGRLFEVLQLSEEHGAHPLDGCATSAEN
jgi:hypothetical protein